jgi:hypothetical protein
MDAISLLASALPLPIPMRLMKDRPWLTRRLSEPIGTAFHPIGKGRVLTIDPMEACRDFLRESGDFEVDETREKFYLTYSPRGFLKRVR